MTLFWFQCHLFIGKNFREHMVILLSLGPTDRARHAVLFQIPPHRSLWNPKEFSDVSSLDIALVKCIDHVSFEHRNVSTRTHFIYSCISVAHLSWENSIIFASIFSTINRGSVLRTCVFWPTYNDRLTDASITGDVSGESIRFGRHSVERGHAEPPFTTAPG